MGQTAQWDVVRNPAGNGEKYLTPDFSSYPNVVVLIPMNHYGELFKDENISDFERYNLLIDVIDNIGRELLENQGMDSYFFEVTGTVLRLFPFLSSRKWFSSTRCSANFCR